MRTLLLVVTALMVLGCTTAQAEEVEIYETINALQVRSILQDLGFTGVEIDEDDDIIVQMLGTC